MNYLKTFELFEMIKVPIKVGDTILGGRFKNKKVLVKKIGKNDKGDITINGKPLLKFRIIESNTFNILEEKLLSYGGTRVAETYEEDLDKLLLRGEFFEPDEITVRKMTSSKCHRNCADVYNKNKDLRLVTGWALLDDVWVQHSWLYDNEYNEIIETTEHRDVYFGFILNSDESDEFCDLNW
jgi:hypothetical protein